MSIRKPWLWRPSSGIVLYSSAAPRERYPCGCCNRPSTATFRKPVARVEWSEYQPSNPASRNWQAATVVDWQPAADGGKLRFRVPDIAFQFVMLRVQLFEDGDTHATSPLAAEIAGCVVEKDQARLGQRHRQ